MTSAYLAHLQESLKGIESSGLLKRERILTSPQSPHLRLADGRSVINFCANNYLGLANHPSLLASAHAALDQWGYGLASVRFICGTQAVHRELETKLQYRSG